LGWNQVDGILRYIDSLESVVNTHSEEVSANIQNFGVFGLRQNSLLDAVQELSHTNDPTVKPGRRPSEYEFVADPEVNSLDSAGTNDYSEPEVAWDLCNLQGHDFALEFPHAVDPVIQALPKVTQTLPTDTIQLPSVGLEEIYTLAGLKYADNRPRVMTPPVQSIPNTLEDLVVPSQERFLMGHYRNRVVNIFCVIDNAKSPWKTIHLPRVLQCGGELSFGGTTTRIRNALRNSLLSISAFYFSNDLRANRRNEEAENWGTIASRYRCDAIGLLKYAVETDLYADEKPRYKEFLATMLSMITINVSHASPSRKKGVYLANTVPAGHVRRHKNLQCASRWSRKTHHPYGRPKVFILQESAVPSSDLSLFTSDI
jgi:arginine metabolism regulation protein II